MLACGGSDQHKDGIKEPELKLKRSETIASLDAKHAIPDADMRLDVAGMGGIGLDLLAQ